MSLHQLSLTHIKPSDATQDPSIAKGERTVPPFDALDPSLVAMNSIQAGEEIPT